MVVLPVRQKVGLVLILTQPGLLAITIISETFSAIACLNVAPLNVEKCVSGNICGDIGRIGISRQVVTLRLKHHGLDGGKGRIMNVVEGICNASVKECLFIAIEASVGVGAVHDHTLMGHQGHLGFLLFLVKLCILDDGRRNRELPDPGSHLTWREVNFASRSFFERFHSTADKAITDTKLPLNMAVGFVEPEIIMIRKQPCLLRSSTQRSPFDRGIVGIAIRITQAAQTTIVHRPFKVFIIQPGVEFSKTRWCLLFWT